MNPLLPQRRPVRTRTLSLLGACCLALAAAWAQAHADPEVTELLKTQRQVTTRDGATLERHAEQLGALSAKHPDDPLVLAYRGAATARRATATMLPWKKIGFAEDGLAMLDKALALLPSAPDRAGPQDAPSALETRLVAANTFLALPSMFHRSAQGKQLLEGLLADPQWDRRPPSFRSAVHQLAGEQAVREDRPSEARKHFEAVLQLEGPEAPRAKAALQGLPS